MRASQTVLPFKLTASDESLTAHAGLVLFDEYLGAMGIAGLINHELPGAGSAAGYDPSAHVAPLVLMLAGGGRTLEDLRVLRRDDGLRCVVGLDEMPSSDASGDWMRRMGANESGGLAGLQRVNRCVFRRLLRADERTDFTLDIDATQIVAEKREARYSYKGQKGYMPMVGHIAENSLANGCHRICHPTAWDAVAKGSPRRDGQSRKGRPFDTARSPLGWHQRFPKPKVVCSSNRGKSRGGQGERALASACRR